MINIDINYEKLKSDLMDYFGSAIFFFWFAYIAK